MNKEIFVELMDRYVSGTLTGDEWKQLSRALDDPENLIYLDEDLLLSFMNGDFQLQESDEQARLLNNRILEKMRRLSEENTFSPASTAVVKKPFFRRWGWAAAAAVLLLTGTFYWRANRDQESVGISEVKHPVDPQPGRNGAILKLADGTEVVLDSLGNGVVASQKGAQVILKNGELQYMAEKTSSTELIYNTMTTPKGRQFQLVLPDGTKVWLNAASSIVYPVAFSDVSRDVKVSGEAYFEVAKMKMPFKVVVNNEAAVEVLGTHFNIKAYAEENHIQATLLEGRVKTTLLSADQSGDAAILAPGQQAQIDRGANIKVLDKVDIDKVMAWKNGLFNFENAGLDEVMRQLARWYDIEVVYEKGIPDMTFGGEMSRNISLTGLLSGLERAGVHFRITEERKLIVTP